MKRYSFPIIGLFLSSFILCHAAQSAVPQTVNYRGRLLNAEGAPVADDSYFINFALYDSESGGTELWNSGIRIIAIADGLFSYNLGSNTPLPEDLFSNNASLYLGITIGTDPEIAPRTALTSSAFSFQSLKSDTAQYSLDAALLEGKDAAQFATGNHAHPPTSGSIFTHWGSRTAPAGTTVLYSGFGYASHGSHSGTLAPLILQSGDPGPTDNASNGFLYPIGTAGVTPPGIASSVFLQGSVCFSEKPTFTLWGGHTPPSGWTALYLGYALGPHYTTQGPQGPLCVDSADFDAGVAISTTTASIYSVKVASTTPGDAELSNKYVRCVVCQKE